MIRKLELEVKFGIDMEIKEKPIFEKRIFWDVDFAKLDYDDRWMPSREKYNLD